MKLEPLPEFSPVSFPDTAEYRAVAASIWERFREQIDVTWPTPFSNCIQLKNRGYAGGLVIGETPVRLVAKVPVSQLFRLLEYAYDLLRIHEGLVSVSQTEEIFESLADILAKQALARIAHGLYREYRTRSAALPYVRGRIDISASLRGFARGETVLHCQFSEHTADNWENQIVLQTLARLRYFPFSRADVERNVRKAFLSFNRQVSPPPQDQSIRRTGETAYHRLNHEYRQLHALCRFFLDALGPEHAEGDRTFVPYLVSMSRLFERYVSKWLEQYFEEGEEAVRVASQCSWPVLVDGEVVFKPDLVLSKRDGEPFMVLDTKYKSSEYPNSGDVQQIVAYANHVGVRSAVLIYPSARTVRCSFKTGQIEVRTCVFPLIWEPDIAGRFFLEQVGLQNESHDRN